MTYTSNDPFKDWHDIGDTALIHFKISMRLLIFIEVRPIIYQKLQNLQTLTILCLNSSKSDN